MRTAPILTGAALGLAALLGGGPAAAQESDLGRSLAARTSLVVVPRVNLEYDRDAPTHGGVTFGGTVVWIPARLAVGEASFQKSMLASGSRTLELGGGWRIRDGLGGEHVNVIVGGRRTRDSVITEYLGGQTATRHFSMVRAGVTSLRFVPETGPSSPTMTAVYAGVSRNKLINTGPGMTNLRVIQRTGVDILIGSAPAGGYGGGSLGFRAYVSRDVGGIIGWSAEVGSRPGFGGYGLATMDLYFMFTDMLR